MSWLHGYDYKATATTANLIWHNSGKIIIERVKMLESMKFVGFARARAHFVLVWKHFERAHRKDAKASRMYANE